MKPIAIAVFVAVADCRRPPPAPKFCDQDLSGVWVNASDTHFAYRLSDKGDTVNGQFFAREADGGEAPSEGEPIRIELKRAGDALAGVMKGSGQSPTGRVCPVDFKLNVTSCDGASLQIVAETRVSVSDDCTRARSEDGGIVKATLVEYRWQRP
jgi:hypothetical protein